MEKNGFFEGQSFHILLKSDLVLSIDQDLVHYQIKPSADLKLRDDQGVFSEKI